MKSKNSKAQNNQAVILEKLQAEHKISISQIMELLKCNRQSAYNYIKRLEKNGYSFQKTVLNNHTYYSLTDDCAPSESDKLLYRPITADILRKYAITRQLQNGPVKKEAFRKLFTINTRKKPNDRDDRNGEDLVPLDIGITQFYSLLNELIKDGEVELDNSGQKYFLTGRNIPLQITLDEDNLCKMNIELSTATKGTPYYEQFYSLYVKTSLLLGNIDIGTPCYDNYFVYGKKINGLSDIALQLQKFTSYDYKKKVLKISHITKHGETVTSLLATGIMVYSIEKDTLYLIGENHSSNNMQSHSLYTVIDTATVTHIEETNEKHDCYHSKYFEQLFHSMFSISTEEPVKVIVEFDRFANIERKVAYLASQRKNASIKIEKEKIVYSDFISGLSDFAMYLRKFGKSAHVIQPSSLKEKMQASVKRALARYEEEDENEIL